MRCPSGRSWNRILEKESGGMMRWVGIVALSLLLGSAVQGQRQRRAPTTPSAHATGIPGLVVTLRGAVKKLTKKEILIESDENQLMTMRVSGKTKFLDKDNKTIKPTDIDLETVVSIDASEDLDTKLMAVNVRVAVAPPKSLGK
jgi:hypothetical protein